MKWGSIKQSVDQSNHRRQTIIDKQAIDQSNNPSHRLFIHIHNQTTQSTKGWNVWNLKRSSISGISSFCQNHSDHTFWIISGKWAIGTVVSIIIIYARKKSLERGPMKSTFWLRLCQSRFKFLSSTCTWRCDGWREWRRRILIGFGSTSLMNFNVDSIMFSLFSESVFIVLLSCIIACNILYCCTRHCMNEWSFLTHSIHLFVRLIDLTNDVLFKISWYRSSIIYETRFAIQTIVWKYADLDSVIHCTCHEQSISWSNLGLLCLRAMSTSLPNNTNRSELLVSKVVVWCALYKLGKFRIRALVRDLNKASDIASLLM